MKRHQISHNKSCSVRGLCNCCQSSLHRRQLISFVCSTDEANQNPSGLHISCHLQQLKYFHSLQLPDYNNYNIESADLVLHEMYHSATVPESAKAFAKKCRQSGVPFYFVTPKSSADYETSADISDMIIFNTTLENAFARFNISQAGD